MYIPDGSDDVAIRVLPFWDVAYSALMPFVSNRVAESVPLTESTQALPVLQALIYTAA